MKKNRLGMGLLLLASVAVGCGGGGGGYGGGGGDAPAFAQADVTGGWDLIQFDEGNDPGWMFSDVTMDSSGNISVNSSLDSSGTSAVGPVQVRVAIDAGGTMSLYDTSLNPAAKDASFHGTMSAKKNLFVATDNDFDAPSPPTHAMVVGRKRVSS